MTDKKTVLREKYQFPDGTKLVIWGDAEYAEAHFTFLPGTPSSRSREILELQDTLLRERLRAAKPENGIHAFMLLSHAGIHDQLSKN